MALHQISSARRSDGSSLLSNDEICVSDGSHVIPSSARRSDDSSLPSNDEICVNDGSHVIPSCAGAGFDANGAKRGFALDSDYYCFLAFLLRSLQPPGPPLHLDLLDDSPVASDNLGWPHIAPGLEEYMVESLASLEVRCFHIASEPACLHLRARVY